MQFNQIIYTSDLENVIYNNVNGIKVIHELYLTQNGDQLQVSNHLYAMASDGTGVTTEGVPEDGVSGPTQSSYGHAYITQFAASYLPGGIDGAGTGIVLPPNADEVPGVFELKNPKDNVKGIIL